MKDNVFKDPLSKGIKGKKIRGTFAYPIFSRHSNMCVVYDRYEPEAKHLSFGSGQEFYAEVYYVLDY